MHWSLPKFMPVSEQINVDRLVKLTFTLNPPLYSPLTSNKTPRYLKSATKHVKTIYRHVEGVPVFSPWMGNVAWARKFWSLNMSISYTTKRRKAKAELHTVNWNVFLGQVGLRPLSATEEKKYWKCKGCILNSLTFVQLYFPCNSSIKTSVISC